MVESPHMEPHTHTHSGRESDSGGGREIERRREGWWMEMKGKRVVGTMEEWIKTVKERGSACERSVKGRIGCDVIILCREIPKVQANAIF